MKTTKAAAAEALSMYFIDVFSGKTEFNPEHVSEVIKTSLRIDTMPAARKLAVELFAAALDAGGRPDLAKKTITRFEA